VIPALRDIEPTAARHAAHTAALLRQERDCIEQLAQVNGTAVDVTLLCSQPPAVAMQQLRQLLHNAGVPMGEIGRRHLDALRGLAEKPTGQISLPGRYCAVRAGDRLEITRQKKQKETILPIRLEQSVQLGAYTVQITRKISDIYSSFKQYPIAYDTINNAIKNSGVESLQIRTWRPTDRMTPFGARGARTLKRLYTERGILPAQRDTLPVICCGEDIVAAIGIGVDQKYSGSTGMLLFSLTGEDSTK
jgi:tRNA(Ile)-lysidine synthase